MKPFVRDINNEDITPEVELLNLACLDLVGQIEELKEENARLKKQIRKETEAKLGPEPPND